MAASTSTTKRSSSSCGCGGSGHSRTSSCSCGGSCGGTCATCQTEGYSRPRFFAGQLLTEDDLQQLGDYVVAKNRQHASHLFGAGVVCGLEVTCFPCGGGKVIVNPGYALDCCGNDIVLACPQELDINQMVRDLQRRLRGGFDCGDPCANTSPPPKQRGAQDAGTGGSSEPAGEGGGSGQTEPARHVHKYCLYIDYCEQQSDPVSPYATDDPCTPQACQTTRIREGFRFELRCPDDTKCEPAICARYHDCMGDRLAAIKSQKDSSFLAEYGRKIFAAREAIRKNPGAPTFDVNDFLIQLSGHVHKLHDLFGKLEQQNPQEIPSELAQTFVEASVSVTSDLARYYFHPSLPQRAKHEEIYGAVGNAQRLLADTLPTIQSMLKGTSPAPFETQLAKDYAASLADLLGPVTDPRFVRGASRQDFEATGAAFEPVSVPIPKDTLRLLAEGVVATRTIYNSAASSLDDLRAFLISRLEQEAMKTHCCLLDSVVTAPKPQAVYNADPGFTEVSALGEATGRLTGSLRSLLLACFCDALNPPCPTCDDPGVLLACVTLEDCKVKDICNLDRHFVLSPVAIRYWIPEITRIGCGIEEFCCPDPCADEWSPGMSSETEADYLRANPNLAYAALVARMLIYGCEEDSALRAPFTSRLLQSVPQPLRDSRGFDLFVGPAAGFPQAPTAVAAAGTEEAPTVSELATKLRKAYADHEKLRVEVTRLSEKLNRLAKKVKGTN